jgi:hypothetical protein
LGCDHEDVIIKHKLRDLSFRLEDDIHGTESSCLLCHIQRCGTEEHVFMSYDTHRHILQEDEQGTILFQRPSVMNNVGMMKCTK